MKRTTVFAVFFIALLTLLILTACGKKQATTDSKGDIFRRPDFGQPERLADISGIVKSVIGNEVTIIKIERPTREQSEQGESEEGEQRPTNLGTTLNGGSTGGRGMGRFGGGHPPDEGDEDSRAAMLERMKEMSSGEETVTIPVGIQMLKPDTNSEAGRGERLEATLADITADKMIQVWLDENVTDRKIGSFVLIMR